MPRSPRCSLSSGNWKSTLGQVGSELGQLQNESRQLTARLTALATLAAFTHFAEIDWASAATQIAKLQAERAEPKPLPTFCAN